MISRIKKSKPKSNNGPKNKISSDEIDKFPKFNPCVFFSGDEIGEIKAILKIKEVVNIPIAIGCVLLNKLELLQNVLKQGVDVNENGPNSLTALGWAVRYKYINFINCLLENHADPFIQTDSGDNVIIVALESKLWDEASFINFWEIVKQYVKDDFNNNCTNKNGNTILHIAVRREWERFIAILLKECVDVNIPNINGVTPLMTACFRNNLNIVNTLVTENADIKKEDAHHRTALCYAILSGTKLSKPPFPVAERMILEMKSDKSECFKEFIKKMVQMTLDLTTCKEKITETTLDMLTNVTKYLIQHTDDGVKCFLEYQIMQCIEKALPKADSEEKLKIVLLITLELACYNEQVICFSSEIQKKISQQFLSQNLITMCLDIVKRKEHNYMLAFYVVLLFCTSNEIGQKWLSNHYAEFRKNLKNLPQDYINNVQAELSDEKRLKLIQKKLKKLKKIINSLENPADITEQLQTSFIETNLNKNNDRKPEHLFSLKKSKRRIKQMKAKIAKAKNTEMSFRVNLGKSSEAPNKTLRATSQCSTSRISKEVLSDINHANQCFISKDTYATDHKIQSFIPKLTKKVDTNHTSQSFISEPVKEDVIIAFPLSNVKSKEHGNVNTDMEIKDRNAGQIFQIQEPQTLLEIAEDTGIIKTFMTEDLSCPYYEDRTNVNPITDCLKDILKTDEEPYENLEDKSYHPLPDYPDWKSKILKLPFDDWSSFGKNMGIDKRKLKESIQYLQKLSNAQNHILLIQDKAIARNVDTALQCVVSYLTELLNIIVTRTMAHWENKYESKQKNRYGRQHTTIQEKNSLYDLQTSFTKLTNDICTIAHDRLPETVQHIYQLESTLMRYPINGKSIMADVCALENVKIQYTTYSNEAEGLFLSNVENVLNGTETSIRDDINIKVVEEQGSFWEYAPPDLYQKEMALLSHAKPKNKKKQMDDQRKTMENSYHILKSIKTLLEEEDDLVIDSDTLETTDSFQNPRYKSDVVLNILTKHVGEDHCDGSKKSKWCDKIQHLKMSTYCHQILLGGDIKVCKFPERNYIISQGGNFNFVTLGLSANDQPLAVKKIPRGHGVCKILKTLINPLLGLRNKNLLQYFVCDYEENDLILATPLCEYNIGQYILLKKDVEKNLFNLNPMDIVRQVMNGLAFLHQRMEPIIHGNLKPSNIFLDINGTIKMAEFGINEALYKIIEAPNSSLIWFSQETYRKYKISSIMECTLSSDIQVAGMVLYFIISSGEHPYGPELSQILNTLESHYTPEFKDLKDHVFADLISWMLMCEPNDRPSIKQILEHVFFWTNDRKWRFILHCAGISTNGIPLSIDTAEFHNAINNQSLKDNITGNWVNLMKKKFPRIQFESEDSVVGLLRFIRQFYEEQVLTEQIISDLKNCILSHFHAFPLSLYRVLESTGYLKEIPFVSYTVVENLIL